MSDISASEYISRQEELNNEARQLMPWDASKCTYEMGALRQQVYVCRTHNVGICYSCSIQCHTHCDIVELFTKRRFTCECGTEKDSNVGENGLRCQLRKNTEADIASLANRYGHNFQGQFCSCDKEYDPESDVVMLQCILGTECNEDWYHDHCISGYEEVPDLSGKCSIGMSLKKIPPLESFDAFICWKCTKKYDIFFKRIISHPLSGKIIAAVLPRVNPLETSIKSDAKKRTIDEVDDDLALTGDYSIFLKHGYSEHLKELKNSCPNHDKLYIFFDKLVPFLLDDDPVYEPPMEDDAEDSDDLICNALQQNFHREQAVAGISALNALKSKLADFLKPFAETGQIVKEEDIKSFFSERE